MSAVYRELISKPVNGVVQANIVCEGDSNTIGASTAIAAATLRYSDHIARSFPASTVHNVGTGGAQASDVLPEGATQVDPLFNPAADINVAMLLIGANDLQAGEAAASIYGEISTWTTARQAAGFQVMLQTYFEVGYTQAGADAEHALLNAAILGNAAGADAVCDLTTHASLNRPKHERYRRQQTVSVHLTIHGYAAVATMQIAALSALFTANGL